MPYLVPAWALRIIGASTMMLPSVMVSTACHQLIPSAISDEASMYVGTQADIEIHSAAMSLVAHLRWAIVAGARSSLMYGDSISPTTSLMPSTTRTLGLRDSAASVVMRSASVVGGKAAGKAANRDSARREARRRRLQ